MSQLIRYFRHKHHTKALKEITEPVDDLAAIADAILPEGKNKNDGLRALKQAREAFIKARNENGDTGAAQPGSIGRARDRRQASGRRPPHT